MVLIYSLILCFRITRCSNFDYLPKPVKMKVHKLKRQKYKKESSLRLFEVIECDYSEFYFIIFKDDYAFSIVINCK